MKTLNLFRYRLAASLLAVGGLALGSIATPAKAALSTTPTSITSSEPVPTEPRRDLGDAPDSTNHAGLAMSAYAGVSASFPTVFDPAVGVPQGPAHLVPRPFHLGQQVSREAEADVGPDEDPSNNIVPAANTPDLDRFDDGVQPGTWNLTHCQKASLPAKVFINQQAVNWFTQQERAGFINIWLDINRDGDWADAFTCQDQQGQAQVSVEHIVIDSPVNVIGLGIGLHTVTTTTGYIVWPTGLEQEERWVRVTLSERRSNKGLVAGGILYGDGRGFASPFTLGETEDYLARLIGQD